MVDNSIGCSRSPHGNAVPTYRVKHGPFASLDLRLLPG